MHIKTNRIPVVLTCVLAVIYIMEYTYIVRNNTLFSQMFSILETIVILLIGSNLLLKSYRKKTFVLILIVSVILITMYAATGFSSLISMFLIIVSLKNEDTTKVYRGLFFTFLTTLLFVLFLYIIGISNAGEFRRNAIALGFSKTNRAAMMIQIIYFLYLMQKREIKLQRIDYVVAIILSAFTYFTTRTHSSTFILLICPFLIKIFEIMDKRLKHKNLLLRCLKYVPIVYLGLYLILIVNYSNPKVQILNSLMSNRIFMCKTIMDESGITFFGNAQNIPISQIFDPVRNKYINFFTVDCNYIYLLINYGIVGTCIWMAAVSKCLNKALLNNNFIIVAVLLLVCTWFFTETENSIFSIIPITYLLMNDNTVGRIENEKVVS